jgi:hypothetical protein
MLDDDADNGPGLAAWPPGPPPPRPGPVSLAIAGAELLAWMHRRAARGGEPR